MTKPVEQAEARALALNVHESQCPYAPHKGGWCDENIDYLIRIISEAIQASRRAAYERAIEIVERLWEEPGSPILADECEMVAYRLRRERDGGIERKER